MNTAPLSHVLHPRFLYGIVLLSALGHALWNAMLKRSSDRLLMMTSMRLVGVSFGLVALSLISKYPWLIAATFALWGHQFLLVTSYEAGDLSFVYPLGSRHCPSSRCGLVVPRDRRNAIPPPSCLASS
jgi:hypothetical protein